MLSEIKFRGRFCEALNNGGHWHYWGINGTDCIDSIDLETVGQYTERKASGIEVYQGDIIKATLPEHDYGNPDSWKSDLQEKDVIGEVKIRRSSGVGFIVKKIISNETKGISIGKFLRIKPGDKIIGNIYENPELLEVS